MNEQLDRESQAVDTTEYLKNFKYEMLDNHQQKVCEKQRKLMELRAECEHKEYIYDESISTYVKVKCNSNFCSKCGEQLKEID